MTALIRRPRKERLLPGKPKEATVALEAQFDLVCHVQFAADGRNFGAYLLRLGEKYRLTFGFDCDGIHPNLPDAQLESIYDLTSNGFKSLPENELLTIHMRSFVDDTERTSELARAVARATNPVLQYIATTELKRVEDLSAKGLRKAKQLRMFATFTYDPDADVKDDRIEKITKGFLVALGNFSGAEKIKKSQEFFGFLEAGFNAFLLWEQIFTNKMGLTVHALTVEQLWADLWNRYNSVPAIPVPQKLIFDRQSIREEINSNIHATSLLMRSEESIPDPDYRWIKVKRKFIGILSLLDHPDSWKTERDALNFYWKKLGEDKVYDIEIVTQLSKLSQTEERQRLTDVTKEQIFKAQKAAEEGDVNVGAGIDLEEALEARAYLHKGEISLSSSTVFLIHRDTVDLLDRACSYLENLFIFPANLHRETNHVWTTWFQTQATCWSKLLQYPLFTRVGKAFNGYVLGTIPLTTVQTIDRSGVEFLSEEGGVPIYLDLVNRHHHMVILATHRTGKSVVLTGFVNKFLIEDIPVTLLDYPPTDSASTFKDYTRLVGGAYFDVGSEAANIFELPNINHLSREQQADRRKDYEDYLLDILLTMVMGAVTQNTSVDGDIVRSILALVLAKFFDDYEIKSNYRAARSGGLHSPAWAKYPALPDFVGFCSPERIGVQSPDQIQALNFIVTKLRYWLTSRIGQALSRPSTFATDSKLFVMAMRGVNNPEDAAILSMCMYGTALRRAFSHAKSAVVVDEAAIALQFPYLANQVGKLCANGAKAGIRVILCSQEPGSIKNCAAGDRILGNCDIKLVGRVQPEVSRAFQDILMIPKEILNPCMTDSFAPNQAMGYSNWILLDGRSYTRVRAYASAGGLAAVVNNPHEVARRQELIAAAEHPILGLHQYASELIPN